MFGIASVPDADPRDGVVIADAPQALVCTTRPDAVLCADFDETQPEIYSFGTPSLLDTTAVQVVVMTKPVGSSDLLSPPNALDVVSAGGTWDPMLGLPQFGRVDARFALYISDLGTRKNDYAGLFRIAAEGTSFSSCYADVAIDENVPQLVVLHHCDGFDTANVGVGLPAGWVEIRFVFDLTIPRASVYLNGHEYFVALAASSLGPHAGYIQLGMLGASFAGLEAAFDSLLVTTN